jgi:hypothetical protein
MRYMVSYSLFGFPLVCGNQCFDTKKEMNDFINHNSANWKSHSLFQFEEHFSGISQLQQI